MAWSSCATIVAGISPATMRQNTHSGSWGVAMGWLTRPRLAKPATRRGKPRRHLARARDYGDRPGRGGERAAPRPARRPRRPHAVVGRRSTHRAVPRALAPAGAPGLPARARPGGGRGRRAGRVRQHAPALGAPRATRAALAYLRACVVNGWRTRTGAERCATAGRRPAARRGWTRRLERQPCSRAPRSRRGPRRAPRPSSATLLRLHGASARCWCCATTSTCPSRRSPARCRSAQVRSRATLIGGWRRLRRALAPDAVL